MGSTTNDMRRIQDRMDHFSTIIRDGHHVIREFHLDCVKDPAVRRWTSTVNKSDFRAVRNAKAELRRMLVNFDGMMNGTFVRPSQQKAAESTKAIKLLPPPPVYDGRLPMATVIQPQDHFDWRAVVVTPMFPMDTTKSKDSLQSAIRTMFNEHLEAANAVKARIDDNEAQKRELEKLIAQDSETHARTFVFLERLKAVDQGFSIMPDMKLKTSVFHVQAPSVEKPEQEQKALGTPSQRAKRVPGKSLASELQLHILEIMKECPNEPLSNVIVKARLHAKGIEASATTISACLGNSATNKSKTLPVERVSFGVYRLKQPELATNVVQ